MKINFSIKLNETNWLHRLFRFLRCRHDVCSVEENFQSRYGTHTEYIYCLKCGRQASEIERSCKHERDGFGECSLCLTRLDYPCQENHEWVKEPDTTDEYYCDKCGCWKGEGDFTN